MASHSLAKRAYAPNGLGVRTHKSIEVEAIGRVTHRLKSAIRCADFVELSEAVSLNRILWNTLAADVASEGNKLPGFLRANIFYLSEFTNSYSKRILREGASAAPLLEVNVAILRGLQSRGGRDL